MMRILCVFNDEDDGSGLLVWVFKNRMS